MAVLALVLIAAWLLLVAGLRTLIQTRRTGPCRRARLPSGRDGGWLWFVSSYSWGEREAQQEGEREGADRIP